MVYLPFLRLPLLEDCIIIVRLRFIVKSGPTLIPSIWTVKYSVSSLWMGRLRNQRNLHFPRIALQFGKTISFLPLVKVFTRSWPPVKRDTFYISDPLDSLKGRVIILASDDNSIFFGSRLSSFAKLIVIIDLSQ